ncbi:hypothetical protein DND132_2525 [Pseudodesulfovibrio mercurii]|uniref:Uncharacterized protein n=1 Tax=Pseudodesulfovibrio mercurii TaxID=641491 RepID=F0JCP8_9BACT|nr:hypothetical protein [Pseudodesulfovibrio mercurii]EGB15728.1 hypothetical protein DND132_2525 [Pseudodesulfovibrio mercurii]
MKERNSGALRHNAASLLPAGALLLLCLVLLPAVPASADGAGDEQLVRTVLISEALGKSFSGEEYRFTNASVRFAGPIKPSGFLTANKARMTGAAVRTDDGSRMTGSLSYADPLGRKAVYLYTIDYEDLGNHNYRVRKVGIKTCEPVRPVPEGYFVPADGITLKKMKAMPTADLLAYAREHGEPVARGAQPSPAGDYHVLVFCMHRLRGNPAWTVTHNGQMGQSWSRGDWHVAAIDATLALNAAPDEVFAVYYGPGERSPFHGKIYPIGGIVSRHVPSPGGPVAEVEGTERTANLLREYRARTLANMTP